MSRRSSFQRRSDREVGDEQADHEDPDRPALSIYIIPPLLIKAAIILLGLPRNHSLIRGSNDNLYKCDIPMHPIRIEWALSSRIVIHYL